MPSHSRLPVKYRVLSMSYWGIGLPVSGGKSSSAFVHNQFRDAMRQNLALPAGLLGFGSRSRGVLGIDLF